MDVPEIVPAIVPVGAWVVRVHARAVARVPAQAIVNIIVDMAAVAIVLELVVLIAETHLITTTKLTDKLLSNYYYKD